MFIGRLLATPTNSYHNGPLNEIRPLRRLSALRLSPLEDQTIYVVSAEAGCINERSRICSSKWRLIHNIGVNSVLQTSVISFN